MPTTSYADKVAAAGHLLKAHRLLLGDGDTVLDLACGRLADLLGGLEHFEEADELLAAALDLQS